MTNSIIALVINAGVDTCARLNVTHVSPRARLEVV